MNDDPYDDNPYAAVDYGRSPRSTARRRKSKTLPHSGPGIASFILSIVSAMMFFAVFAIAIVAAVVNPDEELAEGDPRLLFLGLGVIGSGLLTLLAVIFGVIGLIQTDRKKIFPIIGLVISSLTLIAIVGVMVLGMMA
ncbi:MAG: hypothetical protein FJ267_12265 [Planctomycetes bacterium]|nr:hypothetical protein [Planctomycetota bacterium]